MPYIQQFIRKRLNKGEIYPSTAGELNYAFASLIIKYLSFDNESYTRYNDCIGALECCKLEIYRRLIAKYEDKKIQENGDVF